MVRVSGFATMRSKDEGVWRISRNQRDVRDGLLNPRACLHLFKLAMFAYM
jgi:hypothetical protein